MITFFDDPTAPVTSLTQQLAALAQLGSAGAVLATVLIFLKDRRGERTDFRDALKDIGASHAKTCESLEAGHARAQDRLTTSLDKLADSIKEVQRK